MKTSIERHKDNIEYVWRLKLEDNDKKFTYGNGFSLEGNIIVSLSYFFYRGKKHLERIITGRRLIENGFSRELDFVYGNPESGIVVLEEKNPSNTNSFAKLSDYVKLRYAENVYLTSSYGYGSPVACFNVGNVAFPTSGKVSFPQTNHKLCGDKNYEPDRYSEYMKAHCRILGDIVNKITLEKALNEEKIRMPIEHYRFLRVLYSTLPVIQCNEFSTNCEGGGAPVLDGDGFVVGMMIGGLLPYGVAIHGSLVKACVEYVKRGKMKLKDAVKEDSKKRRKFEGEDASGKHPKRSKGVKIV